MKKGSVLLCDNDRTYLGRLHGYLRERIRMAVEWQDFTDTAYLPEMPEAPERTVLVIAQRLAMKADLTAYPAVLILTEGAEEGDGMSEPGLRTAKNADIKTVSRYQRASVIADKLLTMLGDTASFLQATAEQINKTIIVGYYSPLGRCMQTSAAMSAGQLLGEKHRTLFIGFDTFATSALAAEDTSADLSDLLYYFGCDREKLPVWIQRAKRRMGAMEYIPPAASILQTAGVDGTEWVSLIRAICTDEAPDYLLLDLSVQTQGLFDILSVCDVVYTITGHDGHDAGKIDAYKRFVLENGMEDLLRKTIFCKLPKSCRLPRQPEMLGASALAAHMVKNGLLPQKKRTEKESLKKTAERIYE